MREQVKLSIVCITYNHARFIRDALNGFVMQKTNFPFEILVHDDASTDGTADVIREYEAKYPDLFRCVYQTENQWGKKDPCKDFLFPMVQGKYVALNEGDDYWTDENKLQKQVDFMELHPDFSVCFHPVIVHWDDDSRTDTVFPTKKERFNKTVLTLDDLLKHNFIQTNSVVYRWRFHQDSLNLVPRNILPGDYFLHLLHAQVGKIGFLNDVMSVYRRHRGGIWTGKDKQAAKDKFWNAVHALTAEKYTLAPVWAVGKLAALYRAAADREVRLEPCADNFIYRVKVESLDDKLPDLKYNSGFFFEYDAENLAEIAPVCTNKCQTMTYYGIGKEEISNFIRSAAPKGIDRAVPMGKSMDFTLVWDGYDLIRELSRIVKVA